MCGLVQDHDTVDHTVDHTVPVDLSGSPRIALVLLELPAEVTPAARHEKSSGHQIFCDNLYERAPLIAAFA